METVPKGLNYPILVLGQYTSRIMGGFLGLIIILLINIGLIRLSIHSSERPHLAIRITVQRIGNAPNGRIVLT